MNAVKYISFSLCTGLQHVYKGYEMLHLANVYIHTFIYYYNIYYYYFILLIYLFIYMLTYGIVLRFVLCGLKLMRGKGNVFIIMWKLVYMNLYY